MTDSPAATPEVIDGGSLQCSALLIKVARRVLDLEPGTAVHLITADPVAPIDLPVWCRMTGHRYRGVVTRDGDRVTYAFEVAATATRTRPDRPWHPVEE